MKITTRLRLVSDGQQVDKTAEVELPHEGYSFCSIVGELFKVMAMPDDETIGPLPPGVTLKTNCDTAPVAAIHNLNDTVEFVVKNEKAIKCIWEYWNGDPPEKYRNLKVGDTWRAQLHEAFATFGSALGHSSFDPPISPVFTIRGM